MTGHATEESFILSSPWLKIDISFAVPPAMRMLLSRALSGWHMRATGGTEPAQVRIRCHKNRYFVESRTYAPDRGQADLISALNELLIAIAYVVRSRRPNDQLLHCAAYEDDRGSTVLFGERKAGKSVFVARKAVERAMIYSDDILLWSPRRLEFTSLGLAPRLRRPVLPDIIEAFGPTAFLAGQFACYLASDACDLAPAGTRFSPDRIRQVTRNGKDRSVWFHNVLKEIARNRIY